MLKKVIWGLFALMISVLIYAYVSPYIVLHKIQIALEDGDSESLSAYIDYPSVRESFRTQINEKILREINGSEPSRWSTLGGNFATNVMNQVIDTIVTPEGVMLILQGKKLKEGIIDTVGITSSNERSEAKQEPYTTKYIAINHFEVKFFDQQGGKPIVVYMIRDGVSWKINKIVLNLA